MIKLTKVLIIMLHSQLIDTFGGTEGLRDEGLFESAINASFQTFGEVEAYPSIIVKATGYNPAAFFVL
ncbi:MAG: hypothetical protein SO119_07690 [Phascolarctobacterium sp.]|nr:hypothetical protein [Phascolarctobacterium sp.]